jgi:DNA-binding transcriptional ArsR family regulator
MPEPAVLDRVFHALSDPSRRAIVERLAAGDASVSELARPLPMSLAAVVQHVQALEASGLVRSTKTGRVRRCSLDRDVLALAEGWLTQRRDFWSAQLDRLGEVLAGQAAAAPAPPAAAGPRPAAAAAPRSPRK